MKNQKNIDDLFEEKLKGFEQQPRPEVWAQIQDRMQQKKKRRIAVWWWYAGAAAILLLSLFVWMPEDISGENNTIDPIITVNPDTNNTIDSLPQKQPMINPEVLKEEETLLTENAKTKKTEQKIQSSDKKNTPRKTKIPEIRTAEKITANSTADLMAQNAQKDALKTNTLENVISHRDSQNDIQNGLNKNDANSSFSNAIAQNDALKNSGSKDANDTSKKEDANSIFDTTKSKDDKKSKLTEPKKKALFTQMDEDFIDDKTKKKKWSVRPLVALSTVARSSSSPADQVFQNNPTQGNTEFNYGVSVAYQVNDRLTFQTGVLTQNVNFDTQQVSLIQTPTPPRNQLNSLNIDGNLPFALSGATDAVALSAASNVSNTIADADAELNQAISYVEIPMEVKYRVTESKRLRTAVIGGFSSLFLRENEVILESDIIGRRSIGTASNLNSINFSGNFGVEFDYKLYKKLYFNVNPMVKVHLNTFSRDNNGYLPVFVGVYSGVKYQF